jgi:hypothetical protein
MWKNQKNVRNFFDSLGLSLNIKDPEDWYQISPSSIIKEGGSNMLRYFKGDYVKALNCAFPECKWMFWKFRRVPRNYWDIEENQLQFFQYLQHQLDITSPEQWRFVSSEQIKQMKGYSFLEKVGGLEKMIQKFCSKIFKEESSFKSQNFLLKVTQELFPGKQILSNYKHPLLKYSSSNTSIELDIFLPEISLALEYHGTQHFQHNSLFGECDERILRDQQRRKFCKESGITLIEVPYWWDKSKDSLAHTIHLCRNDLIRRPTIFSSPIPSSPPVAKRQVTRRKQHLS